MTRRDERQGKKFPLSLNTFCEAIPTSLVYTEAAGILERDESKGEAMAQNLPVEIMMLKEERV